MGLLGTRVVLPNPSKSVRSFGWKIGLRFAALSRYTSIRSFVPGSVSDGSNTLENSLEISGPKISMASSREKGW